MAETNAVAKTNRFSAGVIAYRAGQYVESAQAFRELTAERPASGVLQNLGNAEWQSGRGGYAILAWEQALWLNPLDRNARNNLRFARETAQLEAPELTWYEFASSWLPATAWAWLAGVTLWLAVGALVLPGFFRWRKSAWQQAVAAFSFGAFLLCIPAHVGTLSRANLGFVLEKETPLRLTPTSGADNLTRLAAGDPARKVRTRGDFIFIRTSRSAGWIKQNQFRVIGSNAKPGR
ncbi:MAG: hypothetical protein H7Y43_08260 [Akkermansiaceae bacterium]|nr:hypothetical protein [Verrucomicrobiales bacterium]